MKVLVRGHTYSSVPVAAKILGVTTSTVYTALHRGTQDTLGIGQGKGLRLNGGGGRPKQKVVIGRVVFSSYREAADALGYTTAGLRKAYLYGKSYAKTNLMIKALKWQKKRDDLVLKQIRG